MIIYRGINEIINIEIDNNTQLKKELGGEDVINSNFVLSEYIELKIGDYINWNGKKYTIFKQPEVNKDKADNFVYTIEFGSDQYRLLNALYLLDGSGEFYLLGDLNKFANLLIENLNRLAGENYYSLGSAISTSTKNLNFSNANCLLVLQQIATEFGVEFEFSSDGKTLNFYNKIGNSTNLTFKFKQGLRTIQRQKISDKNLVTKLYAFGSERNISSDYGSKRLKIEPINQNTGVFGIIEGVVNFDDVYPHREGIISSLGSDVFKFSDNSLDFNINEQLIPNVTAKITFNSGYLAGYEFEISSFNNTTKEFDIIQYEDENGLILPNDTLKPQIGDKYVVHDIIMPQSYIDAAEAELTAKATAYLNENSKPNVIFNIVPHYPYLRTNSIQLNIGDIVTVQDEDFGIDYETRIISLTQSLSNPYLYSIKVGDKVAINYITKVLSNQLELDNNIIIEKYDRTIQYNRIRRNLKNVDELKDAIFDPDGYFDTEKIKPFSVETSMLSVGNKGQQFIIRNLLIEANYQGDPTKLNCGNGVLIHFTIEDEIKEWVISGNNFTLTDENDFYYIYAKCSKSTATAEFEVTQTQYKTEATSSYYFLIGVLHSEVNGVRGISLTYGQTTINGKFITTGKIKSIDGLNYFDLDNNKFFLGDGNSSLDWNVTNANRLTIKGSLLQTAAGDSVTIPNSKGVYSSSESYYKGDTVNFNGNAYINKTETETVGIDPSNTSEWELFIEGGQPGKDGNANAILDFQTVGGVTIDDTGNKISKTTDFNGVNLSEAIYSNTKYTSGCVFQMKVNFSGNDNFGLFGLYDNAYDVNASNIAYSLGFQQGLCYVILRDYADPQNGFSFSNGDLFMIKYDNTNVTFYKNGIQIHTQLVTQNETLGLDIRPVEKNNDLTTLLSFTPSTGGGKGSDGKDGNTNLNLGLIDSAHVNIDGSGHKISKTSSNGNWDASVRSSISYVGGALVQFAPSQTDKSFMMGLSQTPKDSNSYTNLNFALYARNTGEVLIYEDGSYIGVFGAYVAGDIFGIHYKNNKVIYTKNDEILKTTNTTANRVFYLDSSFNSVGNNLTSLISFTPSGSDGVDGVDGTDGADGEKGDPGPSPFFQGEHSSSTLYYNNSKRVDIVKRNGIYYIYKGPNASSGSWNSSNWENFGAQFESVATKLLLAEEANIADWIIKNEKITSQSQFEGEPNAQLNGENGSITFIGGTTVYSNTGSKTSNVKSSTTINRFGLDIERESAAGQEASILKVYPDYIFMSGSKSQSNGDIYQGQRIAFHGDIRVKQRAINSNDFTAAFYGKVHNTETVNPAAAYGGYFEGLRFEGPYVQQIRRLSGTVSITNSGTDYILICTGTSTINLPPNPVNGRSFIIKKAGSGNVVVNGNGNNLYYDNNEGTSLTITAGGRAYFCVFDGVYWQIMIMYN